MARNLSKASFIQVQSCRTGRSGRLNRATMLKTTAASTMVIKPWPTWGPSILYVSIIVSAGWLDSREANVGLYSWIRKQFTLHTLTD